MSARNSLTAKARRREERKARKARAQLVRDTERKVREALEQERMEAIRRSLVSAADGGNVDTPDYESMKVDELRALAAEREVRGRSRMTKAQLIEALRGEA